MLNEQLLCPDVELVAANLFSVNLSEANLLYAGCVTWPLTMMQMLESKLENELPEGARVITLGQTLPGAREEGVGPFRVVHQGEED